MSSARRLTGRLRVLLAVAVGLEVLAAGQSWLARASAPDAGAPIALTTAADWTPVVGVDMPGVATGSVQLVNGRPYVSGTVFLLGVPRSVDGVPGRDLTVTELAGRRA
jgi:hypothetical protein